MEESILKERFELAIDRIMEIRGEALVKPPYREYFQRLADFVYLVIKEDKFSLEEKNKEMYRDILPESYGRSYGNPAYALQELGEDYGNLLSYLYAELRGLIPLFFEKKLFGMTILLELFLEVYNMFCQEELPAGEEIKDVFYWFNSDYCDELLKERVKMSLDSSCSAFALDIIKKAESGNTDYLYDYGEYISDNEKKTAEFFQKMPEQELEKLAKTYTEGYRMGFENAGIDLSKKKSVNIRYSLGFEKMVAAALRQFKQLGLEPLIYRSAVFRMNQKGLRHTGFYGATPNKQYDYDHSQDESLFLDEDFSHKKVRSLQVAYEKYKDLAGVHAGPAVIETFGEEPFVPFEGNRPLRLSAKQQQLQVAMDNQSAQIINRYIPGDERSFTIIAFPTPEIGDDFEEIFKETVKLNTLDYAKYQKLQQTMIDALDKGDYVRIKGKGDNKTDLSIRLWTLEDAKSQTKFENCVADVNIPVGEVFTSPVLKGTEGILHVSKVYLNDYNYLDLQLTFKEGMVETYTCKNFSSEEENKAFIKKNLLFHHESLPMGEFAIGTNTCAYAMAKKYKIAEKLPILIAEKMGPHFAIGDTCYSWAEDNKVYNRDGKEIVARDNEISRLRKEDLSKAYFGCHTDITIPYEELESVTVYGQEGYKRDIIRDGRFVLEGTQELNIALEEAAKL